MIFASRLDDHALEAGKADARTFSLAYFETSPVENGHVDPPASLTTV